MLTIKQPVWARDAYCHKNKCQYDESRSYDVYNKGNSRNVVCVACLGQRGNSTIALVQANSTIDPYQITESFLSYITKLFQLETVRKYGNKIMNENGVIIQSDAIVMYFTVPSRKSHRENEKNHYEENNLTDLKRRDHWTEVQCVTTGITCSKVENKRKTQEYEKNWNSTMTELSMQAIFGALILCKLLAVCEEEPKIKKRQKERKDASWIIHTLPQSLETRSFPSLRCARSFQHSTAYPTNSVPHFIRATKRRHSSVMTSIITAIIINVVSWSFRYLFFISFATYYFRHVTLKRRAYTAKITISLSHEPSTLVLKTMSLAHVNSNLNNNWRITVLQFMFYAWGRGFRSSVSALGPLAGLCEQDNKP